ncbi:MAG: SdpI family protein, partial [Patescibacteria group bacterium]
MSQPIKRTLKTEWFPILLLLIAVGFSAWSYNLLPDMVATHWNIQGQVDAWGSKKFNNLLFPGLLIAIYLLFNFIPNFDPKKERYAEFANVYLMMRNAILSVFVVVFGSTTLFNLGYPLNISAIVGGAIGILFLLIGNYFGKLKLNYFVGFRTPWTLSSENVWNKTHRVGGKAFIILGLIMAISPWLKP